MNKSYNDGIYDISSNEYHSSKAFSRSQLLDIQKSPYHFWYKNVSGIPEDSEPTEAMVFGSIFHTLFLEPEKFEQEYAVSPELDKRTKSGKEIYSEFVEKSSGKQIISTSQFLKAEKMVKEAKKHKVVDAIISDSVFEKSVFWTDKETGIQFKSRPDIWSSTMIADLKTISSESGSIKNSALKYGYFLQAGMAYEASLSLGDPFDAFVILAIEKEAPYAPSIHLMNEDAINFGRQQFDKFKMTLVKCLSEDKWPCYEVNELTVPEYAYKIL